VVAKHFWSDGGFFGEAGGAIDWVHGEEGSPIVARAIGLGKDFSRADCEVNWGLLRQIESRMR
jgi:hypothetical protein